LQKPEIRPLSLDGPDELRYRQPLPHGRPRPQAGFRLRKFARANSTQLGIIGVFVSLFIIFIIAAPQTFLKGQIYYAFMSTVPFFAIMAIPLTMIVIAAEMDLSFPSVMAMGMVAFLLT